MKVILFGASGMVGQGVLRECLLDADVSGVLSVGRSSTGKSHPKLTEIVRKDLLVDFSPIAAGSTALEADLTGLDACFFCLGVSSAGMSEDAYRKVTYDITMAVATTLVKLNPNMTFVFVSGASTDSTERGRVMWARVKGAAENAVLKLPFKAVYVFRPAAIQPLHGITSRTPLYRALYTVAAPLFPLLRGAFPKYVTTTETVGRAMLHVVRHGAPKRVLENDDINRLLTG